MSAQPPARYVFIRVLRGWLWGVAAVVAFSGGSLGYALAHDQATHSKVLAGILGAISGALASASVFLVLIAFLSLALEIAQSATWIASFLYDQLEDEDESTSPFTDAPPTPG